MPPTLGPSIPASCREIFPESVGPSGGMGEAGQEELRRRKSRLGL